MPQLKKAQFIYGSSLVLRNVNENDSEFIFNLRRNPLKNQFLSPISEKIEDQINWIREYTKKTNQAYFIVCDKKENKLGCVRLYDPIGKSYCWGSWILLNGLNPLIALESSLLVYAYGNYLGFEEARIDVRQKNKSVWTFHEKIANATLVKETSLDRFYIISKENINRLLNRYSSLINYPLNIKE